MGELKTSIVIDVSGNLEKMAARYTRTLERFSETGRRHLVSFGRAADDAGRVLDRVGNRYTALVTGAAAAATAKMVMDLELRFVRLGIQAGKGAEEIDALKNSIFDVASASDVRVDPDQLLSGVAVLLDKTNNIDFTRENLRNLALAIQATGESGETMGTVMGEMFRGGVKGAKEMLAVLDTMTLQGKDGGFGLDALARYAPHIVSAYTAMGHSGAGAMQELGAAMQVLRQSTGDPRRAQQAIESLIATFRDKDKQKELRNIAGIDVFDPVKLDENGQRAYKSITALMTEIVQKSKGDLSKIGDIFDESVVRGLMGSAGELKRSGTLETLAKFQKMQGDGKTIMEDSARAAQTASAALTNLFTAWKRFADSNLTGPIQSLANLLNSLSSEKMNTVMQSLKWAGIALGGALVLRKVGGIFTKGATPGADGFAGGVAGALGGGGMPIPVYVVNKHLSLTPDAWMGSGGIAGSAGKMGKAASVLAGVGRATNIVGLGATVFGTSYAAGSVASGYIDKKISQWTGRDATLGTFIYDLLHRSSTRPGAAAEKQKVDVNVKLEVEGKDATARAKEARAKGGEVDVETGTRIAAGA